MATKSETKNPKQTKAQTLVDLISRPHGATVDDLMKSTGRQKHTVRAVISTEKKKRGLKIELDEGRYMIVRD